MSGRFREKIEGGLWTGLGDKWVKSYFSFFFSFFRVREVMINGNR